MSGQAAGGARRPPAGAKNGSWAVGAWVALVAIVGYAFALFDWEWGILRGSLLIVAMAAGTLLLHLRRRAAEVEVTTGVRRVVTAIAVALVAYHLYVAIDWMATTRRADKIKLDQGQTLYRALRFFPEVNPYGQGVLLDPVYYIVLTSRYYHSGCLRFPIPSPGREASEAAHAAWRRAMLDRVTRFWWHYDLDAADELMPEVSADPRCDRARVDFNTLGFKYGPLTLAAFVPWVALFDKAGVFLTQTLLFCALCALVFLVAAARAPPRARQGRAQAFGFIALVVMLAVPMLRNNLLLTSALDGTATALCLLALWLFLTGRATATAAVLGLALGAKLLPSLLYLPLLLALPSCRQGQVPFPPERQTRSSPPDPRVARSRWFLVGRAWALCALCAVAPYLPFLAWDAEGLYNNVVLFPLTRGSNTTSLAYYLPAWLRPIHTGFFALTILVALYLARRARFSPHAVMRYLLVAHMGVLAGSTILHNNYTIWFSPILALFTIELMVPGDAAETTESASAIAAGGGPGG